MKAIVWTKYGPPEGLQLREVRRPAPRRDELLIRIRATAVAAGDSELRGLRFSMGMRILVRILFGPIRPRAIILGQEFAGEVEAVGREVSRFRIGDSVYGTTGFGFGAYAEYICVRDRARDAVVAIKPANLSFEEAATVPTGGLEAVRLLRMAGELRGRRVLVIGAAGGIGGFAVQLAKTLGAEVTGVDAARKLEFLRKIGADHVVDQNQADFTTGAASFDVIFDAVGRGRLFDRMRGLRKGGTYLLANPSLSALLGGMWARIARTQRVLTRGGRPQTEELDFLRNLIESGKVRATIDRRFPLDQVPEAHRYFDSGMALGRVVITV